jgi:hypothetical protein
MRIVMSMHLFARKNPRVEKINANALLRILPLEKSFPFSFPEEVIFL